MREAEFEEAANRGVGLSLAEAVALGRAALVWGESEEGA